MLIEYKDLHANLVYCGKTKLFYGEILGIDACIAFQATNRQQAILAMHRAVDKFLHAKMDLTVHLVAARVV